MEEMEPLPFKPREFKPRSENVERKSPRFESKEGENTEKRPSRRENDFGKSEFKSREFKPREYKPRTENGDESFVRRDKPDGDKNFRNTERPAGDNSFRKEDRPDRRKVEKVKLKPVTRIEERGEQGFVKKSAFEFVPSNTESVDAVSVLETPVENQPQREPSKGNKFTEQRDYKITRTRELRPRKPKSAENEIETPKAKPEPKSEPKPAYKPAKPSLPASKKPIDNSDLED